MSSKASVLLCLKLIGFQMEGRGKLSIESKTLFVLACKHAFNGLKFGI